MPTDLEQQSSELVVYAARLVRAVRRRVGQLAGMRILALLDELGPHGMTALADADRSSPDRLRCGASDVAVAVAFLRDVMAEQLRGDLNARGLR